jgi:hypothetical protein
MASQKVPTSPAPVLVPIAGNNAISPVWANWLRQLVQHISSTYLSGVTTTTPLNGSGTVQSPLTIDLSSKQNVAAILTALSFLVDTSGILQNDGNGNLSWVEKASGTIKGSGTLGTIAQFAPDGTIISDSNLLNVTAGVRLPVNKEYQFSDKGRMYTDGNDIIFEVL